MPSVCHDSIWYRGVAVFVRPLLESDIGPHYQSWFDDPEIRRFIKYARSRPSLESLTAYWRAANAEPGTDFLGFFLNDDGRHIGNMKFETGPEDDEMHVGFLIGPREWRRAGILTDALAPTIARVRVSRPNLRRIYLTVSPDNAAAIGAFNKLGFASTGVIDALGDLEMDYVRN